MLFSFLQLVLGLACLYFGGEWLVRGAARIATALRVQPLFVGLTIVAFGTSAPEMVVCLLAAAGGHDEVTLGNVLGSNIANVGLILALAAVVTPLRVASRLVQRELPFMLGATLVLYALATRAVFGRVEGLVFFLALIAFTWLALRWAKDEPPEVAAEVAKAQEEQGLRAAPRLGRDTALIVLGLVFLVVGGHLLVEGAVALARAFGVSELIIAVTMVAVGTSLPELATSIAAAVHRETDIVVGNLVGSNLFNILGALGLSAIVRPIRIDSSLLRFEFVFLLVFSGAMALVLRTGHRVSRWEGAALLALYAAFVALLFVR